jgi:sugar lactone lactonase YvrE
LETLAYGYGLVEAPRVDADGNLYFSDVMGGGVYRRSPDGAITTVVPKRRGVGGLVLHADGGVVVSGKNVAHVRDGVTRVLLEVEGALGFNDLTTDRRGRVFVGSLRSSAFETGRRAPGELWRIDGQGRATEVYGGIEFANGVGFSPDERTIYHSNYSEAYVLAHDLDESGAGVNRRVFARMPKGNPDGLAVDETGGVWVALGGGGAVARFSARGELLSIVDVPSPFVTSLCFGGADRRDLYVVTLENGEDPARKGTIFRTRVDVPGLVAPPARV